VFRRIGATFPNDADGLRAVESYGDDPFMSRGTRDLLRTTATTYALLAAIAGVAGLALLLVRGRRPVALLVVLTGIGMPDFDAALSQNIADMTDILGSTGAHVVWATYPRVRTGVIDGIRPKHDYPEFAHFRVDRLNTFIREAVAQRPFASVLELRRLMETWPNGELDPVKRPDGIHPNEFEAVHIAHWIGIQLETDPTLR